MSDVFELKVDGIEKINKMLQRVEKKVAEKAEKKILKQAMQPLLSDAKSSASNLGSGKMSSLLSKTLKIYNIKKKNLRRGHIGVQLRHKEDKKLVAYSVGSSSSLATKKTSGKRYFIPNAIEYGHAFPGRGGGKGAPKDVPARPYIRPAYDRNKDKCAALAEKLVKEYVDSIENN